MGRRERRTADGALLETDVAIIGGGPAGAAAAIAAVTAGLDAVVVEALAFPRSAPGETLHPGVEALLRQLGVWEEAQADDVHRHAGIWLERPGAAPTFQSYGEDAEGTWRGFQIPRARLDSLLLDRARRLGAVILQPARVRELELGDRVGMAVGDRTITARYLVDASGSGAWLARKLGVPVDRLSRPLFCTWTWGEGALPAGSPAPPAGDPVVRLRADGWDWTAPLGPAAWAACSLDASGEPRRGGPNRDVAWRAARRTAGPNWFLAGDAAAVLDPLAGKGVLRALMSGTMAGWLASRVVKEGVGADEAAEHYQAWFMEGFRRDLAALDDVYQGLGLDLRNS